MTYLTKTAAILALLATAACTDTTGGLFGGGGSDVSGAGIGSIDEASLEFSHRDQQQDQPTFEVDENRLSSVSPEQAEASSAI